MPLKATQLDATGLTCPMPVLRAQKLLRTLPKGAVLELLSTDPISQKEVPLFCQQAGYMLQEASEVEAGLWRFLIQK